MPTSPYHTLIAQILLFALAMLPACGSSPTDRRPVSLPGTSLVKASPADDGTYLERIDPLGGRWLVQSIGEADFNRFAAWVNFSEGGFLNHGAGCEGGFPAFYQLHGDQVRITRREALPVRMCKSAGAAAARSEQRLAQFLDHVRSWSRAGNQLTLVSAEGTRATLARPTELHPELAGRWVIDTIGGKPLVTERRPPTLSISMDNIGAHADCNSFGAPFTLPSAGKIRVAGPVVSTLIGCSPEDAAEDNLMAQAITLATAYEVKGDTLILSGGSSLVARRPRARARELIGDYEHCGNTLLGAYHEGPITISITNRTMRDGAGCVATYSADGPDLKLELASSPACAAATPAYIPGEPVALGGTISVLAVTRPDGFGFDEQGRLILRTRRGLLSMCRSGAPRPFGE